MYCTQNLGHKIGGAVFMSKLTKKDKIEIYERNKRIFKKFETAGNINS